MYADCIASLGLRAGAFRFEARMSVAIRAVPGELAVGEKVDANAMPPGSRLVRSAAVRLDLNQHSEFSPTDASAIARTIMLDSAARPAQCVVADYRPDH
jgi:hypothetical protein